MHARPCPRILPRIQIHLFRLILPHLPPLGYKFRAPFSFSRNDTINQTSHSFNVRSFRDALHLSQFLPKTRNVPIAYLPDIEFYSSRWEGKIVSANREITYNYNENYGINTRKQCIRDTRENRFPTNFKIETNLILGRRAKLFD